MNRDTLPLMLDCDMEIWPATMAPYHGDQMPPASLLSGHLSYSQCIDGFYDHPQVPCFILKNLNLLQRIVFYIITNYRFL